MDNFEENNFLQVAANLDKTFVEKFRKYCRVEEFKQKTVIRRLLAWWLFQDITTQQQIYRGKWPELHKVDDTPTEPTEPSVEECIENIKHFVTIKLPSLEEQRMISALRKALGPEPKQKRKRG